MPRACQLITVAALALAAILLSTSANAGELRIRDGQWRFEIAAMKGTNLGKGEHGDAWSILGEVEYEMPLWQRWTLSAQVPVLIFDHYDDDEDESDVIVGTGFGVGLRVYQHAETRHGFFIEGSASAIVHTPRFEDNSSNLNFITQGGIGYKWRTDWHVTALIQHISNASLGDENAGVNSLGLAVGKTF